ncbi:hypothetical protein [Micromonospora sp. NBC_01796]|uniref:hypothetical protein n=1 Tax=Micromonospora sp. NBC_01796 TaxID=2975987 RepID=UPI002DDACDC3|nr:hypothetical protein [Micromonospora sp. NBC_01796]WSA84708.1 hypothetical protein OIE47_30795 [Micromonospora sp. NBC_01796]
MNLGSQRTTHKRALGTIAILAGLFVSVVSMMDDNAVSVAALVLSIVLVLTGVGLRIEVAINESRSYRG